MRVLQRRGDLQRERLEQALVIGAERRRRAMLCTAITPSQPPYMNSGTPSHERMPCARRRRARRRRRRGRRSGAPRRASSPSRPRPRPPPSAGGRTCRSRDRSRRCTKPRLAAGAAVHERDRLGLGDRAGRSRARPPRPAPRAAATPDSRRAVAFRISRSWTRSSSCSRVRDSRENTRLMSRYVSDSSRKPSGCVGIVEQHEHDADRHQRRLGDDARQRELVEVRAPAAARAAAAARPGSRSG